MSNSFALDVKDVRSILGLNNRTPFRPKQPPRFYFDFPDFGYQIDEMREMFAGRTFVADEPVFDPDGNEYPDERFWFEYSPRCWRSLKFELKAQQEFPSEDLIVASPSARVLVMAQVLHCIRKEHPICEGSYFLSSSRLTNGDVVVIGVTAGKGIRIASFNKHNWCADHQRVLS